MSRQPEQLNLAHSNSTYRHLVDRIGCNAAVHAESFDA